MAPLSEAIRVRLDRTLEDGAKVYVGQLDRTWGVFA